MGPSEGDKRVLIIQIQKKLTKGLSVEQIADAVEESVDVVVVTELIEEICK